MLTRKTKRVQIRVTPKYKARLDRVADRLHTNLSDLLLLGALIVDTKACTPADYLRMKAELIAGQEL